VIKPSKLCLNGGGFMTSKKYSADLDSKNTDLKTKNKTNTEFTDIANNKANKGHQSNTKMNFAENFNPDDFE
jgi:hypothetical protein